MTSPVMDLVMDLATAPVMVQVTVQVTAPVMDLALVSGRDAVIDEDDAGTGGSDNASSGGYA